MNPAQDKKYSKSLMSSEMGASKGMRNGKIIKPKQANITRLTIIKALLWNLKDGYDNFVHKVEIEVTPKPLQILLTPYCASILNCINEYPINKDGKVRKAGVKLIENLRDSLHIFDKNYSKYIQGSTIGRSLHRTICDLNGDVNWLVKQHNQEYYSVKVTHLVSPDQTLEAMSEFIRKETEAIKAINTHEKVLAHRPKDWELREIFKIETEKYQKVNGISKDIPYKKFCITLTQYNNLQRVGKKPLKISTKGYYNLKQASKNNLLNRYI